MFVFVVFRCFLRQVPFIEELVRKRSEDLLIYTSMPAVLALKKNLSEEVLEKVSFVPIKNTSRSDRVEGVGWFVFLGLVFLFVV